MTEEIEAEGYHRNLSSTILSFLSALTIYISEGVDIEFMLALSNYVSLSGKVENFAFGFLEILIVLILLEWVIDIIIFFQGLMLWLWHQPGSWHSRLKRKL
jgi:hypothetical protein